MRDASWETVSVSHGDSSMLSIGAFPREDNVSTLSQILMEGVPEKYYLSQKACLGILHRASSRGKILPAVLQKALERQAKQTLQYASQILDVIYRAEDQAMEKTLEKYPADFIDVLGYFVKHLESSFEQILKQ